MKNRIPAFLLQTPYTTEPDRRGDHVSQWIIDKGIRTFSSLICLFPAKRISSPVVAFSRAWTPGLK